MTKGQRIIVSLLVVVAIGLVLNLSRDVPAQDHWDPHQDQAEFQASEHAQALREIRWAIIDAANATARTARDSRRAAQIDAWFNRPPSMPPVSLGARSWPSQPRADSVSHEELQVFFEYLTMTRSDVAQLKDDVANLTYQVHLLQLKHVSKDAAYERMSKRFDERRAASGEEENRGSRRLRPLTPQTPQSPKTRGLTFDHKALTQ